MKSLNFRVVTGLTVFLAVLALFRSEFEGYLPPLPSNRLDHHPGEFLTRAVHQPINWRPYDDSAILESRRTAKPIFLVVGASWSAVARNFDAQIFSNFEVANDINQNFIPVRIDGAQQPNWLMSVLPLNRLKLGAPTGFQAYVFDTKGRLVDYLTPTVENGNALVGTFTDELMAARDSFAQAELTDITPVDAQRQFDDRMALESGPAGILPDFVGFMTDLAHETNSQAGGFLENGNSPLLPSAYQAQLRFGRLGDLRRSLDPLLLSPACDAVRGGFYQAEPTADAGLLQFDQSTSINAEMASVLAEAGASRNDPLYLRVAHDTFDMVMRDLRVHNRFAVCRIGDGTGWGISPSASFPARRLNQLLSSGDVKWTQTALGLDPSVNRQMIPHFASRAVLDDPDLHGVLVQLRNAPTDQPPLSPDPYLDINGHAAACLLRCARIWNDRGREDAVLDSIEALEAFRSGDRVFQTDNFTLPGTYLGDDLAYADAQLEYYLARAREPAFENGLRALQAAVKVFPGESSGVWLLTPKRTKGVDLTDVHLPEIADDLHESCTAQMIRLLIDYGRMLGPKGGGSDLIKRASESVARYAQCSVKDSCRVAGLYAASACLADPQCAFAVGPDAQNLADALYRLRPGRLVAVAEGPVRPDLRGRAPGIYVVNGDVVAGPYSVQKAAALVPPFYQVGVLMNES